MDSVYIKILIRKDFLYVPALPLAFGGFVDCLTDGVFAAYDLIQISDSFHKNAFLLPQSRSTFKLLATALTV